MKFLIYNESMTEARLIFDIDHITVSKERLSASERATNIHHFYKYFPVIYFKDGNCFKFEKQQSLEFEIATKHMQNLVNGLNEQHNH
jgi:hypothetical protein